MTVTASIFTFFLLVAIMMIALVSSLYESRIPTLYGKRLMNKIKHISNINTLAFTSIIATQFIHPSKVLADVEISSDRPLLTRADVGMINLNETMPRITDVCYFDIQVGQSTPQRIEISLFGDILPQTTENFISLCENRNNIGYKDSNIFRVISEFSIQAGNIGNDASTIPSKIGKYGRAANAPFPAENFRILHSYQSAGVVSMMKDLTNKGLQDSRFFVTVSSNAGWADDRYSAFGLVTSGMSFIQGLTVVPVERPANYPLTPIKIVDSGVYPTAN